MLFLVRPTFFSNFLSQLYATINSVESNVGGTMGTVLEQGKLNDEIIKIFKKIFPNPNIVFKRLKETEFYTISLDNQSDIDFAELEKKHVINPRLHNNLTNPALTLRFIDSASGQDSTMGINKILFDLSTTMPNYTPFTDKELYGHGGAKIQEMIQNGKKLSGIKLNNLNLNNTNYPGVSFSGSDDMNDSQFVNAKLIGADFADAELNNADFTKADLRGSDFPVATITGKASFVGADLKFSNFSGADLTGADLSDADFRHTNLSSVTLTDCIINENTKIYGAKLDDAIYDENLNEANMTQYEDDEEYEEYIRQYDEQEEEEEEELDYSTEDELAEKAEELKTKDGAEEENILPPLVIDKTAKINDRYGQTYTFENIVSLLSPKITNVKIPLSQMGLNKWYGIASLGNTVPSIWEQVGVNEPHIGTVFKSEAVPNQESGEAIVYETVATCMAVHELSRMLDINNLFKTFLDSVDSEVFSHEFDTLTRRGLIHDQDQLDKFAMMLYNYLLYLLSKHNDDETVDSWTHIYDDIEKRKQLVKHAVFNSEEGIMYHPRFDYSLQNGYSEDILLLIMFIESLPPQVQVAWAQNYIKEFIEGYGQQLETFDRTKRSDIGFIASCLNGNLEKFLLSITPAIVKFYPLELEEETEEQKLQNLKSAVTGSFFEKYYKTVDDVAGPTLEGYKNYIQTNPEFNNKEELRRKYLELLEDQTIIDKITETIDIMSGGKKKRVMKFKTMKRRKTIKRNTDKKKHKKTVRKNNKLHKQSNYKHNHKKTIKKNKKGKNKTHKKF
jgi:uncharacterized protein YjbI with pentapeptide repeats